MMIRALLHIAFYSGKQHTTGDGLMPMVNLARYVLYRIQLIIITLDVLKIIFISDSTHIFNRFNLLICISTYQWNLLRIFILIWWFHNWRFFRLMQRVFVVKLCWKSSLIVQWNIPELHFWSLKYPLMITINVHEM